MLKDIIFDNDVKRKIWDEDALKKRREQLIKFAKAQWKDL